MPSLPIKGEKEFLTKKAAMDFAIQRRMDGYKAFYETGVPRVIKGKTRQVYIAYWY